MKYALISPLEPVNGGFRVADVVTKPFDIAAPFFFVECDDTIVADAFIYLNNEIVPRVDQVIVGSTTIISTISFIERFTEAEQLAIVSAAMVNPAIKLWYDKLLLLNTIEFTDTRLSSGLDLLVSEGIINQTRKYEVLPEITEGVSLL